MIDVVGCVLPNPLRIISGHQVRSKQLKPRTFLANLSAPNIPCVW
jgi:hypothetical protein